MHLHVPHVVLIVLVHVACASSVVNFDGLTAFWSFNGNVKNTVTNVSLFNQHNATRFVADHWGRANSALFVNGGYLQMPVGVYFNGSLTIAMWILVTKATASSPQTVLSVQNGNPGWRTDFVRLTFELNTGFNLDYGISPYVMQSTANFMSSVALQQWNHVAVTIAQSLVTFYLNGSSWFSTHTMTGVSVNGVKRVSNYIGSSDYMALNAYLNDVMLFTRGLSGAEVAELAASYQDWTTTSTRAPADLSGLVAYWTFNGQTKNNVSGVSLFNQHNCRSYVGDRRGRARSALYLNSGYAQIPAAVFFTDTFTTTFWIYWLGNTNSATIYTMKMVFRTMIYFSFDLKLDSSGILQMAFSLSDAYSDQVHPVAKSKWTHVALVSDFTITQQWLYVNGNLGITYFVVHHGLYNTPHNASFFGQPSGPLSAYLDDMMMFNRALSANDVLATMLVYN